MLIPTQLTSKILKKNAEFPSGILLDFKNIEVQDRVLNRSMYKNFEIFFQRKFGALIGRHFPYQHKHN